VSIIYVSLRPDPGLWALLTSAGDVELVNPQLSSTGGRSLDELRLWGQAIRFTLRNLPRVAQIFARSIKSGNPYDFEAVCDVLMAYIAGFRCAGCPFAMKMGPSFGGALCTRYRRPQACRGCPRVSECI